jgi:hydrogenase maturation protein HypF
MEGRRIELRGTVQGVGFRPWILRLARRTGVRGRVRNDARGLTIEAFGPEAELESFVEALGGATPRSARVVELSAARIPHESVELFEIEASDARGGKALSIPPDLATCPECEAELFDRRDRRHGYSFTNCTACGPRFTIATGIPYDRDSTTMDVFPMCSACRREYEDLDDRRFHAQPNACPDCGPRLRFLPSGAVSVESGDPLAACVAWLRRGRVVAIKGLGGFHLACDATNPRAVDRLRRRKRRDQKPLAVMVRDLEAARALAVMTPEEERLLGAPERPIVLLPRREDIDLAASVAPETSLVGLFLPYTPLHHLLLHDIDAPLVMTSANLSDEPICKDDDEAKRRLRGVADALLLHDRAIAVRCDDSVQRVLGGVPTVLRRSRGFVPRPIPLGRPVARPVLACGAQLKNAFCLAAGDSAYLGPHIGDLDGAGALEAFEEAVERLKSILAIEPEVIAHDLHPGYVSTRYALSRKGVVHVAVQHHHAHVLSAMAEHGRMGPVLGIAFDGTGLGEDGTSWGGEFLLCRPAGFERLASFRPLRLAGGDVAIREVWRIALALLEDAYPGAAPLEALSLFRDVPARRLGVVQQMLERDLNSPRARGVGRYFDAFGALGLGRAVSEFEGQVAMAWDQAALEGDAVGYPFDIDESTRPTEVDLRVTARAAVEDLLAGASPGHVSARFHQTLVDATRAVVERIAARHAGVAVALSGGVFQNARLCGAVTAGLCDRFEILRHREVPPGDGGIALGQAVIADAMLAERARREDGERASSERARREDAASASGERV